MRFPDNFYSSHPPPAALISQVSIPAGAGDTAKADLEDIFESMKKTPLNYCEHCRQHSSASERNVGICISSRKPKYHCLSLALRKTAKSQCRTGRVS